jgi:hypothetical protein
MFYCSVYFLMNWLLDLEVDRTLWELIFQTFFKKHRMSYFLSFCDVTKHQCRISKFINSLIDSNYILGVNILILLLLLTYWHTSLPTFWFSNGMIYIGKINAFVLSLHLHKFININCQVLNLFFPFFCGIRVWTQGFSLAKQVLCHLSHTFGPFLLWLFFGDGVLRALCPGWPQTAILPISASQVARITGVSHLCPAKSSNDDQSSLGFCF